MIKKIAIISCILIALAFAGCKSSSPTPTQALQEYIEAARSRDIVKIKQTTSKRSIEMMEELLIEDGSTLEETIKNNNPAMPPMFDNPEVRNEKINGDRATIELRRPDVGDWLEVLFVMEDGRWKVAAGEQFYEAMEKMPAAEDYSPANSNESRTTK